MNFADDSNYFLIGKESVGKLIESWKSAHFPVTVKCCLICAISTAMATMNRRD